MKHFLTKLLQLPVRRKLILIEALLGSLAALVMIRVLPYGIWRRRLGHQVPIKTVPSEVSRPSASDTEDVQDIAWAHTILRNRLGKHFTCLMLGMSARNMLGRRDLAGLLVLGVNRKSGDNNNGLGAHAWVVHERTDITGGEVSEDYAVVAAYGSYAEGQVRAAPARQ